MKRLAFWATIAFIYPLSLLPFSILYLISDTLFLIVYYLLGYRKKVVSQNLQMAFPDMPIAEREKVAKQFYRNLCDLIMEGIKLTTISKKELQKRIIVSNREVCDQLYHEGRSLITTLGHCGNWEMAGLAASYELKHHSIAIYRPLKNPFFDRFIKKTRGRFGMELVAHNRSRQILSQLDKETRAYHFITDQSPIKATSAHWTTFLNQDTAIFMGTEKVAKMTNMPVLYLKILRTKRGHYSVEIQEVSMNPQSNRLYEITEIHTRLLEENIKQQPDNWLWSHRRWKKKREVVMVKTPAA
ncbi:MAG: lipid A biosynthesis acyltransferase [Chitinophagales bacterium]|nr:lipid A biosynthesis acyltransferase [Chitinophagales bacterium]